MRKLLYILLLLFSFYAKSQTGSVYSLDDSSVKMSEVKISFLEAQISTSTDSVGFFTFPSGFLSLSESRKINLKFEKEGFETQIISFSIDSVSNIRIYLEEHHGAIEEIEIVAIRGGTQSSTVSHVESRSIKELNMVHRSTLMEAVGTISSVNLIQLGPGISKPVIRGLYGSRVLTFFQGTRLDNMQWGNDHGLGFTDLGISKVEVIKGPASLQFGNEALGGVLYFVDESFGKLNSISGEASTSFETNNLMTSTKGLIRISKKKVRSYVGLGFNRSADYQDSKGRFVRNSYLQDIYGRVGLSYIQKRWISNLKYSFQKSNYGLPGHTHELVITEKDKYSENRISKLRTPRQNILTHMLGFENIFYLTNWSLETTIGLSFNGLVELDEKVTIPAVGISLMSIPYSVRMNRKEVKGWDFKYGSQGGFIRNWNLSNAEERIIPNYDQIDFALFGIASKRINNWILQAGIRGDLRNLHNTEAGYSDWKKTYGNVNYSAGGVYSKKKTIIHVNLNSGSRAANASELFADGLHHGSNRYEIGNPNLQTEYSQQLDISYELNGKHVALSFNPYVILLTNYITLEKTNLNIGNFNVYNYNQLKQLYFTGFDAGVHFHPHNAHFLHVECNANLIHANGKNVNQLSLVPQSRILGNIRIEIKEFMRLKNNLITFETHYFLPQNRISSYELRTSDFALLNLGFLSELTFGKQEIHLALGTKNMLNKSYIPHLSMLRTYEIMQAGRSFYFKISVPINK